MKSFLKKKKKPSGDMALQITSMADIFMILLVFLLKSYSTTVNSLAPTTDIKLPIAASQEQLKESLKLEVGESAILIDEKPIVTLKNFEFFPGEVPEGGMSGPLYKALFEQRKKLPNPNLEPHLLVMADQRVPYETIKRVLAAAAHSGFVDLQLVVVAAN